jgi:formamidase
MPEVVFSVDQSKSMRDQAVPGHNRWHPDVPPAASVRPGSEFRVECREWTDAQLGNNDSANDVRDVDLTHAHMLSGPVEIQGAEPGDLLVVDILDLGPVPQETGPAPGQGWGYTGIFAKTKVGLRDEYSSKLYPTLQVREIAEGSAGPKVRPDSWPLHSPGNQS